MSARRATLSVSALLVLNLLLPIPSLSATSTAGLFIEDRARQVLALFNDKTLAPAQREDRLRAIAIDAFDVPAIARSVLGRHWNGATTDERQQFTQVFEHYMVHVYASRFARYHNATVRAVREREESAGRMLVQTEIAWPGAERPAKVDWWIKRSGDTYKILDVNLEGVSQLLTLREEFSTVIQQHDGKVSALIEHLREKVGE